MSAQTFEELTPGVRAALDELQALIHQHYPGATFRVTRGRDDPQAIHLVTLVDMDDLDAVLDVVVDRMMDVQIAEGLPIFVIPVRRPGRSEAIGAAAR